VPLRRWLARSEVQRGAPGLRALVVSREEWRQVACDVAAAGGRLVTLWASGEVGRGSKDDAGSGGEVGATRAVRTVFLADGCGLVVSLAVAGGDAPYPGLEDVFPAAQRMQRAVADLSGVRCTDPDTRPWLHHAESYEFVRVDGDGVHEIAVGPVHAGIIEPGHFRFSVVGEKILRLEERLGYAHKGIERRFAEMSLLEGHRLAARVSGDSTVAFSWAYCQALEGMSGTELPARAVWLRALCLELERIANHLGDLGALGNDAGFGFGLAQFSRLKELLLRVTDEAFGERYLMNTIVPGGTLLDLTAHRGRQLAAFIWQLTREVSLLRGIYDEHEGVRDRFTGAGTVLPELAGRLGLTGFAGRASGQAFDLRSDLPCEPYGELLPAKIGRREGDVAARVAVRFEELQESCRLVVRILEGLPSGPHRSAVMVPAAGALGVGLVEGWRGPVLVGLEAGAAGGIARCHPHDPSWHNWPVLEHAVMGNIVPDFPLINKSFNLSYSGHDL
jgi:Ni,Fe-hydrogenase III large subunit